MNPDVVALFHQLAPRSPAEREAYWAQQHTPAAVRAEVESLLRFDGMSGPSVSGYVAAAAEGALLKGHAAQPGAGPALAAGVRIGPYEVTALLGAGGMGEVYRARDTVLHRDVAVKVLPAELALNADRAARFEREARTLAALNHPHIAQIYTWTAVGDVRALVMELIGGQTLAGRIARGSLPVDEALSIARQIAEALDAAHELGIVHRDLKPANVMVTPDGTVKVLDFGLAKALDPDGDPAGPAITDTGVGRVIAGTPAYSSPEQARGFSVDKRTDIWAFGCVLYEMLTGQRAFGGEQTSDVVAKILEREPDLDALTGQAPVRIVRLLRHCLTKEPRHRLRDIGDARVEIDEVLNGPPSDPTEAAPSSRVADWRRIALAVIGSAALTGTGVWVAMPPAPAPSLPVSRLSIAFPAPPVGSGVGGRALAISPDGNRVVYRSTAGFAIRERDRLDVTLLRDLGTFPADPFFSPDGAWLGYSDGMSLKRVPVAGGMPVIVTEVGPGAMGSWTADGVMYADLRGLFRAPPDGGASVQLAMPELAAAEQAAYPEALPGGHAVLFTVLPARTFTDVSGGALRARVEALDLRTGVRKTIISAGSRARYVSTGHLVYAVGEVLHAVGFDPDRLEVSGNPTPIAEASAGEFALSDEGTLVYVPVGGPTGASLVWVDRSGREEDLGAPGRAYNYPRISPDGTRVALDVAGPPDRDIWMWDLRRKTLSRVTVDPTGNPLVAWTHDSQEVAFGSERFGATNLFRMAADGTGEAERLLDSPRVQIPLTFAPDGRLLFSYEVPGRRRDIYALWMDGTRRIAPVIQTPADDLNAEVSPDGRWIAYDSNESGQFETYVRQYPDTDRGRRWQVSADGGRQPLWSADGRELFYRDVAGNVLAVSVALAPVFAPGAVVKAIDGSGYAGSGASGSGRKYDVAKDGRFLMIKYAPEADYARRTVVVVQNWFEELRRLAPRR